MFLFSKTHHLSYFPFERRHLLYFITNGRGKWAALVPRVTVYSLPCTVSEYFGCLFPVFYLLVRYFPGEVQICSKFKYSRAMTLGNQRQVGTHGRKMTHAEVNSRVTQEISGSHFVKWILTTYIKIVKLPVTKIQGSGCSQGEGWRAYGIHCLYLSVGFLPSFVFSSGGMVELFLHPRSSSGRIGWLTFVCSWLHGSFIVKVQ